MNKVTIASVFLLFLPFVASAQNAQTFLTNLLLFVNGYIIPFLFGIAFLFFVINAVRFFVIGGSNQEGQDKAKNLAMYGVSAFVFLLIFWGLITMLVSSLGMRVGSAPPPDYFVQQGFKNPTTCTAPKVLSCNTFFSITICSCQ